MKKILFLACFASFFYSCVPDDNGVVKTTNVKDQEKMMTTSFTGVIVDENNKPVSGAKIQLEQEYTTSDKSGLFVYNQVEAKEKKQTIVVEAPGYKKAFRNVNPYEGNNIVEFKLQKVHSTSVHTGSTQTVYLNDQRDFKIELPQNAVVYEESGASYSGSYVVEYSIIKADDPNIGYFVPGDFFAIRNDGSEVFLYSYGMMDIELKDPSGKDLQLAEGKEATLTFGIPASKVADAPSEIPLWYFDEDLRTWVEEGMAYKSGNQYVGNVTHFTPHNVDLPFNPATVKGDVRDCNDNFVSGLSVTVDQSLVVSSPSGGYSSVVRAENSFDVKTRRAAIKVDPIPANQEVIAKPLVLECSAVLSGEVFTCDGAPANGVMFVEYGQGHALGFISDGKFSIGVLPNESVTLRAILNNAESSSPTMVKSGAEGTTNNIEPITGCGPEIESSYLVMEEKSNVAGVSKFGEDAVSSITYNGTTNKTTISIRNVDGTYMEVVFVGSKIGEYTVNGGLSQSFVKLNPDGNGPYYLKGKLVITSNGSDSVVGYFEGEFAYNSASGQTKTAIVPYGVFNIKK